MDNYTTGVQGVSHTPSGILDVHFFHLGWGSVPAGQFRDPTLRPCYRRRHDEILLNGP